jgi:hypothetical protein
MRTFLNYAVPTIYYCAGRLTDIYNKNKNHDGLVGTGGKGFKNRALGVIRHLV